MTEPSLYSADGVVVSHRLVRFDGYALATNQISSVRLCKDSTPSSKRMSREWMKMSIYAGLVWAVSFYSMKQQLRTGGDGGTLEILTGFGVLLGGFFGVGFLLLALFTKLMASGKTEPKSPYYLDLRTSDGQAKQLWVSSESVGRDIQSAIERAMEGRH